MLHKKDHNLGRSLVHDFNCEKIARIKKEWAESWWKLKKRNQRKLSKTKQKDQELAKNERRQI